MQYWNAWNTFHGYSSMLYETKYRATTVKGLKILTPKQVLQRLPIALAQIKAGNNSKSLLNAIIVYSLLSFHQSKAITRKVISYEKYTIRQLNQYK